MQNENEGMVNGDIEAVAAPEDSDGYVIIRKKQRPQDSSNGDENSGEQ